MKKSTTVNWDCIINLILMLVNAIGTLLVLTDVLSYIGAFLLLLNAVAQFIQISIDVYNLLAHRISYERFKLYLVLNLFDVAPGIGVLSGIFGSMRVCNLDWVFDYLNKK